jgi:hypothetical protein
MKKFSLQLLRDSESSKPAGYLSACLAVGKLVGDTLHLTDDEFRSLRDRFKVVAAKVTGGCGCKKNDPELNCGFRVAPATCKEKPSCALGFYGGEPKLCECQQCVKAGENTVEFAAALVSALDQSHPSSAPRVSGCCDDARNPIHTPTHL